MIHVSPSSCRINLSPADPSILHRFCDMHDLGYHRIDANRLWDWKPVLIHAFPTKCDQLSPTAPKCVIFRPQSDCDIRDYHIVPTRCLLSFKCNLNSGLPSILIAQNETIDFPRRPITLLLLGTGVEFALGKKRQKSEPFRFADSQIDLATPTHHFRFQQVRLSLLSLVLVHSLLLTVQAPLY